jgi:signal transduction histidine kinase
MNAEEISAGLADNVLQVVATLLPGASAAAGIMVASTRAMRPVGAIGPRSHMLFEGPALVTAYRAMSEHATLSAPFDVAECPSCRLVSVPIWGKNRIPLGALQVLTDGSDLATPLRNSLEALSELIADAVHQHRLNLDLQHSLNQLFLVYEVGRQFNLASSMEDVLHEVRVRLSGTMNFHHCCIMLLDNDQCLVPEAGIGIDLQWMAETRPKLKRSVAALVLESGVTEQITDPIELAGLDSPTLDTGLPPESVLCAPMSTRMGIIGVLELYTPEPYAFSRDERFLLSVLASELATAMENSQLYASLREKEGRLTVLAHKLIHSQEVERKRIARDMHDGLAQMLVSSYQYLQAHAYGIPPGKSRELLDEGLATLAECIDESRNVIFDLRPSTLDDFGLVLALRQFLQKTEAEAGWTATLDIKGDIGPIPPETETAIYRLVKEAVSNARKHAESPRIHVRLATRAGNLVILVRDWGSGFDLKAARAHNSGHFGIMGMRERVSLLNGSFHLRSSPGAGTVVRIVLPLE